VGSSLWRTVRGLLVLGLAAGCYDPYGLQLEAMKWDLYTSPHFLYRLQQGASVSGEEVEENLEILEAQFSRLSGLLHVEPRALIRCYHYKNRSEMSRAMGAIGSEGARALRNGDTGEIHFYRESDTTLRHELVHIFGYEISDRLTPGLLAEGLAVCYEEAGTQTALHIRTLGMMRAGTIKPLGAILTQYSLYGDTNAYTQAGSFVKYLIDTYGIDAFLELYRATSAGQLHTDQHIFITVKKIYGKSFSEMEEEWLAFLDSLSQG
jgi:hypothetical protein